MAKFVPFSFHYSSIRLIYLLIKTKNWCVGNSTIASISALFSFFDDAEILTYPVAELQGFSSVLQARLLGCRVARFSSVLLDFSPFLSCSFAIFIEYIELFSVTRMLVWKLTIFILRPLGIHFLTLQCEGKLSCYEHHPDPARKAIILWNISHVTKSVSEWKYAPRTSLRWCVGNTKLKTNRKLKEGIIKGNTRNSLFLEYKSMFSDRAHH